MKRQNKDYNGTGWWMMVIGLSFVICHLSFSPARAQSDRQYIREGNALYNQRQYEKAEVAYTKAVEQNDKNAQAHYNLGNAMMMQQKDSTAIVEYGKAAKLETNKLRRSQAFHNTGVVLQRHRQFGPAITAYQESLRLNPSDNETRYNLVLCMQQLKNQPQNQDQQKQDQDKQKQDQDKQKEQQKQEKQKQDQDQQKQDQDKQQQEQQKPKMSKENAEQLLEAAMQRERQTQERMKEMQKQNQRRQNEKNW